jgi:transposase
VKPLKGGLKMGKAKKRVHPKISCSVNRNFDELAIKEIVKAVEDVGPCWNNKDQRGNPYPPTIVVVCCILKTLTCRTYDSIESYVKRDKYLQKLLKEYLDEKGMPGHSVIYRGMQKLSQTYIKKLNKRITIRFRRKGMIILVDSTGFSLGTSSKYFDIRIGRKNSKKDNAKLNIIVCAKTGIVPEFSITNWKGKGTGDGTQFRKLLKFLDEIELAVGDGAYLSRENCKLVSKKGGKAMFHITEKEGKKLRTNSRGSDEWKRMITFFKKNPEAYNALYHIRSFIESVNSSIKKRWGSFLKSRRKRMQKKELALKVICYNVKQVLYNKKANELGIDLWKESKQ